MDMNKYYLIRIGYKVGNCINFEACSSYSSCSKFFMSLHTKYYV